ncbi:MAG: nuclear transport factor 2 family protein [Bacteroidetes bacterium]|nr:nuclear transport factor 2 family protein [Bacteroidota bacterium]
MKHLAVYVLAMLLLASCAENGQQNTTDSLPQKTTGTEPPDFNALLRTWAEVMNDSDLAVQTSLYSDTIKYYGAILPKAMVFEMQSSYIAAQKDYDLRILEVDKKELRPDGSWYIHFTKQVRTVKDTINYPSSLVFVWKQNGWKITEETDDITELKGAAKEHILSYSPAITHIEGVIEANNAWNTSKPGSDPKSDGGMVYYVLLPKYPVATIAGPHNNPPAELGITRIQLRSQSIDLKKWVNVPVTVSGRLLHSSAEGVYTTVQMDVAEVR